MEDGSVVTPAQSCADTAALHWYIQLRVAACFARPCDCASNFFRVADEDGLIGETPVKLAQLLDEYVKEEVLTGEELWYCPKCDARQSVSLACCYRTVMQAVSYSPDLQASKKLSLWAAPHYLVIHLKRFSYTHSSKEKIHRPVEFPVKVRHMLHSAIPWMMLSQLLFLLWTPAGPGSVCVDDVSKPTVL
jgi:hypothetical protein